MFTQIDSIWKDTNIKLSKTKTANRGCHFLIDRSTHTHRFILTKANANVEREKESFNNQISPWMGIFSASEILNRFKSDGIDDISLMTSGTRKKKERYLEFDSRDTMTRYEI